MLQEVPKGHPLGLASGLFMLFFGVRLGMLGVRLDRVSGLVNSWDVVSVSEETP